MSEEIKYRVKERNGEFEIQIYAYKEKGFLWWKRKEYIWHPTNSWGGAWETYPRGFSQPKSPRFDSLKKAKKQIQKWNKEVSYYEVD
jgi:phage-related minor tail protein